MSDQVFAGLRVIETAEGIGTPFATKLLADLGAEVIKIEKPKTGDSLRQRAPYAQDEADIEKSLTFLYVNSSKQSLTLDIDSEEGAAILKELLSQADVWVRQRQPEYWAESALSYDELKKNNPGLILTSVTPFGESGPYKDHIANPFTIAHMCGNTVLYPHGTGDEDKAPCLLGGNFEEYDVGYVVAAGIIAALYWRLSSGEGQYLELSEQEARIMVLMNENAPYPVFGMIFDRVGFVQKIQASLSYQTKDGWLCPFLTQTHEFANMAKLMGKDEWVGQEWFTNVATRRENYEKIRDAIQEWTIQYTTAEAVELLQGNKVPIGPVSTPRDVVESEQFNMRGFFTELEHPVVGTLKYPGKAFNLSETPVTFAPAPLLGDSTENILKKILNYKDQKIEALASQNII